MSQFVERPVVSAGVFWLLPLAVGIPLISAEVFHLILIYTFSWPDAVFLEKAGAWM